MIVNNIVFYNHYGNGDIFESREFVKEYFTLFPECKFFYAHGKHPRILLDIPEIAFTEVTNFMDATKTILCDHGSNTLYINTWIGRDSKYVLPGIGCVVEEIHRMHRDILGYLGFTSVLKPDPLEYVPTINYDVYYLDNCKFWLEEHSNRRKVFIDNGNVQSNQAVNFQFSPIIRQLAEKFPDIIFVTSHNVLMELENVVWTSNIIKSRYPFDLNEVSYLSLFCDTLIGRNSGPHVFSQVLENWLNKRKAILSFTHTKVGSTFVLSDSFPMQKFWSGKTDFSGVLDACISVIERDVDSG